MDSVRREKLSRALSALSRHGLNLAMNSGGWLEAKQVCAAMRCSAAELVDLVFRSEKGRAEGSRLVNGSGELHDWQMLFVRAPNGSSFDWVRLDRQGDEMWSSLEHLLSTICHGTRCEEIASILSHGLQPQGGSLTTKRKVHIRTHLSIFDPRDRRNAAGMRFDADVLIHYNVSEVLDAYSMYLSNNLCVQTSETIGTEYIDKIVLQANPVLFRTARVLYDRHFAGCVVVGVEDPPRDRRHEGCIMKPHCTSDFGVWTPEQEARLQRCPHCKERFTSGQLECFHCTAVFVYKFNPLGPSRIPVQECVLQGPIAGAEGGLVPLGAGPPQVAKASVPAPASPQPPQPTPTPTDNATTDHATTPTFTHQLPPPIRPTVLEAKRIAADAAAATAAAQIKVQGEQLFSTVQDMREKLEKATLHAAELQEQADFLRRVGYADVAAARHGEDKFQGKRMRGDTTPGPEQRAIGAVVSDLRFADMCAARVVAAAKAKEVEELHQRCLHSAQKARDRQAERELDKQHNDAQALAEAEQARAADAERERKAQAVAEDRTRRDNVDAGMLGRGLAETPAGGNAAPRDDGAPRCNAPDAKLSYSKARRDNKDTAKLLYDKVKKLSRHRIRWDGCNAFRILHASKRGCRLMACPKFLDRAWVPDNALDVPQNHPDPLMKLDCPKPVHEVSRYEALNLACDAYEQFPEYPKDDAGIQATAIWRANQIFEICSVAYEEMSGELEKGEDDVKPIPVDPTEHAAANDRLRELRHQKKRAAGSTGVSRAPSPKRISTTRPPPAPSQQQSEQYWQHSAGSWQGAGSDWYWEAAAPTPPPLDVTINLSCPRAAQAGAQTPNRPEWQQRHDDQERARFTQLQHNRDHAKNEPPRDINDVMAELDRRDATKVTTMNVFDCPIVAQDPADISEGPLQHRPPRSSSTALAPFVSPAQKVKLMAVNPSLEGSLGEHSRKKHSLFEGTAEQRVPPWAPVSGDGAAAAAAASTSSTAPAVRAPPRRSASRGRRRGDSSTPAWEWGSQGGRSKSPRGLSRSRGPSARMGAALHPVGSTAQSDAFGARAASRR